MAALTAASNRCILKRPLVGIGVTVLALGERQALIARRRFARLGTVTLRAGHIRVESREGKRSPEMIEALRRLPGVLIVATETLGAQLAGVGVLMAIKAFVTQAQKGLIQVSDFDLRACRDPNMGGIVTLFAGELGVLPLQRESGETTMIELLAIQLDQRELPSVVLHVAISAIRLGRRGVVDLGMVTSVRLNATADFGVAIETLQAACGESEVMASCALGRAFQ